MSGTLNLELCLNRGRESKECFLVEGVVFPVAPVVLSSAEGSRHRSTGKSVTISVRQRYFSRWPSAAFLSDLNLFVLSLYLILKCQSSHLYSFNKFSFSAQIR